MEDEGATIACCCCACWRIALIPFLGLLQGQRRVNHRVRHTVHRYRSELSGRSKDLADRRRELQLDKLELTGRCCVCRKSGAPVLGRSVPDGGLTVVDEGDIDELSDVFGVPVRGFLCPTCVDVAARIRVQKALGSRTRGPRFRRTNRTGGVAAAVEDVELPAWCVAAAQARKCDVCLIERPGYFHARFAELLCRRCVAVRGKRRLAHALGMPLPPAMATAVTMLLAKARPEPAARPTLTREQPRQLFACQESDLFRAQAWVRGSYGLPARPELAAEDGAAAPHVGADQLSLVARPTDRLRFSDAAFEGSSATGAAPDGPRQRLRASRLSLFRGRQPSTQQAVDLFDAYWPPASPLSDHANALSAVGATVEVVAAPSDDAATPPDSADRCDGGIADSGERAPQGRDRSDQDGRAIA
jgi:hypothetical protein